MKNTNTKSLKNTSGKLTSKNAIRFVALVLVFCLLMPTVCFADVFDDGKTIITKITSGVTKISVAGAILCGTVAALMWGFSSNQRNVEMAQSWGKRIVVCLLLLGLMTSLVNTFWGYTSH